MSRSLVHRISMQALGIAMLAIVALAGALTLSACATSNPPAKTYNPGSTYQNADQPRPTYAGNGVVHSIETTQQDYQGVAGTGFGLGTLAGAVIGGAVGNQIGHGRGNTAATVAGAAGGAYVGHQLEKRNQADIYLLTIRMDGGSYQQLAMETTGDLRIGDRVRVESNGSVRRY